MKRQKKGTFLPNLTKCEELSVGSDTLEELQNYLKMWYSLKSRGERVFDPEGNINFIKQKLLTKFGITHVMDYEEDVIRNCFTPDEVGNHKEA